MDNNKPRLCYSIMTENVREAVYQSHRTAIDDQGEIHRIAPSVSQKKLAMDAHEEILDVTLDGAYPLKWANLVREKFNLRYIGEWSWAYADGLHGHPVACCERSLALLEILCKTDTPLVRSELYFNPEALSS